MRRNILGTISSFSRTGKTVFALLSLVFFLSAFSLLNDVNKAFLVDVPKPGGTVREGVVGTPRYVNPVLAVTDSEKDLTALLYSGLMLRHDDGNYYPNLAESYSVSPDGLSYTFIIKDWARFHDGSKVTADDVIFTIQKIQDPTVKSPKQSLWEGIAVEKIDERTVKFTLSKPMSEFICHLTLGILSKKEWKDSTPEGFALASANLKPVGTGPYKLKKIEYGDNDIPKSYILEASETYVFQKPYINEIVIKFYTDEQSLTEAYKKKSIDSLSGISPEVANEIVRDDSQIVAETLPRTFALFINQESNVALDELSVREALDIMTDRQYIIQTVLKGFGKPLYGPSPAQAHSVLANASTTQELVTKADKILEKAGWSVGAEGIREKKLKNGTTAKLAFSISTSDTEEMQKTAEILKERWAMIGVYVEIKAFESGYLNQNIIRPRKYDALLFGEIIVKDSDLFAFWHSSQKDDPGLNVALYSNKTADSALEKMQTATSTESKNAYLATFQKEIGEDLPAIFLYSPSLVYIAPKSLQGLEVDRLTGASDRFLNIRNWYLNKEKVWKIFAKN